MDTQKPDTDNGQNKNPMVLMACIVVGLIMFALGMSSFLTLSKINQNNDWLKANITKAVVASESSENSVAALKKVVGETKLAAERAEAATVENTTATQQVVENLGLAANAINAGTVAVKAEVAKLQKSNAASAKKLVESEKKVVQISSKLDAIKDQLSGGLILSPANQSAQPAAAPVVTPAPVPALPVASPSLQQSIKPTARAVIDTRKPQELVMKTIPQGQFSEKYDVKDVTSEKVYPLSAEVVTAWCFRDNWGQPLPVKVIGDYRMPNGTRKVQFSCENGEMTIFQKK